MHYPFWYVPFATSPMLIAAIATVHVFVAMFAVGGGFVMALGAHVAYRNRDQVLLDYFGSFAWFFVLITVVFGAITGVGIWWVIGLASPLATEELIHVFVFVWGMEYATFLVEIVSAFVLFYGWNRLDVKTHLIALWSYAGSAWLSLVLITGITAFMLHSGDWTQGQGLWKAFWNPQSIPQIVTRTGASLFLAALFVFLHAAYKLPGGGEGGLRAGVSEHTSRWGIWGGVLVAGGGIAWYVLLPPGPAAALVDASALNVLVVILFGCTIVTIGMLYYGPYRRGSWVNPGFAILFFCLGLAATFSGEFVREAIRKPYIVYGSILGNQIRVSEVPEARRRGLLDVGVWTKQWMRDTAPETIGKSGDVEENLLLALPPKKRVEVGRVIFQYHCNDCHAAFGYSGMSQLTRGKSPGMIMGMMADLNHTAFFMPPLCATPEEAEVLLDYIKTISRPYPADLVEASGEKSK